MKKILIVEANFYKHISAALLEGATKKISESGYQFEIITVPGALEIPATISIASNLEIYLGYVALGCVIRGQTTHYDYVCSESARALMDLSIYKNLAIGNGILTVENEQQALERAYLQKKDKGGFAASACIEMIKIKEKFSTISK